MPSSRVILVPVLNLLTPKLAKTNTVKSSLVIKPAYSENKAYQLAAPANIGADSKIIYFRVMIHLKCQIQQELKRSVAYNFEILQMHSQNQTIAWSALLLL